MELAVELGVENQTAAEQVAQRRQKEAAVLERQKWAVIPVAEVALSALRRTQQ